MGTKRRNWGDYADSEQETAFRPMDLASHDPRPESVIMAGWGKGLSMPATSTAGAEQEGSTRTIIDSARKNCTGRKGN